MPTLAEQGIAGYHTESWNALFAPKGTPREAIDRMAQIAAEMAKDPAVQKQMANFGSVAVANTPAEFAKMLREETAQARHQPARRERRRHADRQHVVAAWAVAAHRILDRVEVRRDAVLQGIYMVNVTANVKDLAQNRLIITDRPNLTGTVYASLDAALPVTV